MKPFACAHPSPGRDHAETPSAISLKWPSAIAEIRTLRLTPEDIRANAVHVDHRSKSGRPRVVPLSPEAARIAKRAIPFDLQIGNVTRLWNAARSAAGMPGLRLHDLRHAFGSWLIERGAAPSVVRDLMGHSSVGADRKLSHF
jgi:integrase